MSYSMNAIVLSENDIILNSLEDLLSVCERDCMADTSQITHVNLRITLGRRISCS